MRTSRARRPLAAAVLGVTSAVVLSGCSFSPYELPLPGGADLGSDPYEVTVEFRDVMDLVPQSAVRVDDIAVGKVTKIRLDGWTATATLSINRDVELPDNAEATIRQTSLLGEKFVSLAPPATGGTGTLGEGDEIPLDRSGRNPDSEEVLGAASLLFNGGGLEKTNTIVRELNKTLDGNEPEIKELLQTSEQFLGQLDDNKADILTALEKVDRLAVTTQGQEQAIVDAIEQLPEALTVLDEQRDDLVGLLDSLDELSGVATDVIRRTKDDTLAVLRDLEPTLAELANAGDDLAKASELIFTFPFSDAAVGGTLARASYPCTAYDPARPTTQRLQTLRTDTADGACLGDFIDLDINLTLNPTQLVSLLEGVLSIGDRLPDIIGGAAGAAEAPGGETPAAPAGEGAQGGDPTTQLVELVEGLVVTPQTAEGGATPAPQGSQTPAAPSGGLSDLCTLLGSCRASVGDMMQTQSDAGRLVLGPVVTR